MYSGTVSDFGVTNVVLPYELERLNVGGAMNTGTGVFTAPVDGIYHFEFSSMKYDNGSKAFVQIQVNGVTMATSYATALPATTQGPNVLKNMFFMKTIQIVWLSVESLSVDPKILYDTIFWGQPISFYNKKNRFNSIPETRQNCDKSPR